MKTQHLATGGVERVPRVRIRSRGLEQQRNVLRLSADGGNQVRVVVDDMGPFSCTFDVQRVNQNVALAPRSVPNDLDTALARLIILSEMTVLWCRFFSRRRPESWGVIY